MSEQLTGRTRYRLGWFGRLVLQVEYATLQPHPGTEGRGTDWLWTGRAWRDACVEDLEQERLAGMIHGHPEREGGGYQPHPLPPARSPAEPPKVR